MENQAIQENKRDWPNKPEVFPDLMTPMEAAMFLRLNELDHNPDTAIRTLNYWRNKGELKATKYARHIWYTKQELELFISKKTEQ